MKDGGLSRNDSIWRGHRGDTERRGNPEVTLLVSLRDYFAAHAPTADPIVLGSWESADQQRAIYGACAENAYLWADAMLRAREKGAPA